MYRYAQLDNTNKVIGISHLSGEVMADNLILINEIEVEMGSVYSRTTGEFTPPEPQPIPEPQPTAEEIQLQTLLNTEFLVIMSEINGQ